MCETQHSSGSGEGRVAGRGEHGDKSSYSRKFGECRDQLRNYQLLKKDSVPWSQRVTVKYADNKETKE